jgi:glycine betaine/proline transport system permease protein
MLVITALVGSRGLEETTLVAIAQVKPGLGLLAGFGIAALAIVMDRILRGASQSISGAERA